MYEIDAKGQFAEPMKELVAEQGSGGSDHRQFSPVDQKKEDQDKQFTHGQANEVLDLISDYPKE